ncbi:MAG: metal ABC transporter ATP-binding protein [Gammaproteobacteria bacterium]|nr:metal ABC transporter ATP-binding protein [Gammaproteobacteria bacterium]
MNTESTRLIEARGVSIRRKGRQLLHAIDISVDRGEVVTLIGPNGAGKTTLVRVLLGLLQPDSGRVQRDTSVRVGYVPQHLHLNSTMPISVKRMMGLTGRPSLNAIKAALEETGAEKLIEARMSDLSGGELRRVLLSRALLRHPDLLILDEPVQGVDYIGEADLYALIAEIVGRHGCGVLMVSHDLHIVMAATDRVVCLNHHICCTGVPQEVVGHDEFQRLFGTRAGAVTALYQHSHDHVHESADVVPVPEAVVPVSGEVVAATGENTYRRMPHPGGQRDAG